MSGSIQLSPGIRQPWEGCHVSLTFFPSSACCGGILFFFSFRLFILFHGVSVKSDIIKLSLLSGLNHSLSPRST